jgi:WhiB family transcriptional regulator, redox-sensing transcriptional regulator
MTELYDTLWMNRAECRRVGADTDEDFFPESPHTSAGDYARSLCAVCPVRGECLEYALTNHEPDGIWGGKTWRQRRRIQTARRKATQDGPKTSSRVVAIRGAGGRFLGSKVVTREPAHPED